jgi:hypothetical protein
MTSSDERIHAGPGRAGDPQTAVAHDRTGGPPGQWLRPTITRFGFDGTLNATGSATDGMGPGPEAATAGPAGPVGPTG